MSQEKIYLRVVNGEVVYPITEANVIASGEPRELFKEVFFAPKPSVNKFQQLKEKLTVYSDGFGRVDYFVEKYSLNYFLGILQPRNPETGEITKVEYKDLESDIRTWVTQEISEEVTKRLDAFAQERGYDSIVSVKSYATSSNPTRKAEAEHAVKVCDEVWDQVFLYQEAVQVGQHPVSRSFEDVALTFQPLLTWNI